MIKIFNRELPFFLSIKDNLLQVLAVTFQKELMKVVSFGQVSLNQGTIKDGVIMQKQLVAQAIDNLLKKSQPQKITSPYCFINLSEQDVFSKSLTIPKVKPVEFDATIRYQIRNFLPHKIEDMCVDWQILTQTDNSFVVNAVAVLKHIIDSYLDTCRLINILPLGFEPESCSLARLATIYSPGLSLFVNSDRQTTTFSYVEKGGVLFVFSTKYVDYNNNERELLDGIELASHYYKNNLIQEKTVKGIYLVGMINQELGLSQKIQDLFQLAPSKLTPPVIFPGHVTNEQQKSIMPLLGLGMSQSPTAKIKTTITLLPQEIKQKREYNKFIDKIRLILHLDALIFAISAAFIIAIYLSVILQNEYVSSSLSGLEKIIITPRQMQLEKEVLNINLRLSALTKLLPRKKAVSPVLEQFIHALPAGVKVTEFSFDNSKKQLTVRGTANKREDILVLERSVQHLGKVSIPLTSFENNENSVFSAVIVLKQ